jgi:general secretion pathway protein E
MGVEPFLITSTLNGVLAQRLVRRLCPHCRTAAPNSGALLRALGVSDMDGPYFHGRGCDQCGNSGYRGRLAILELLRIDERVSRLILARAEAREIQNAAKSMRTMLEDGLIKARAGLTTLEEIVRVTRDI